MTVAVSEPVQVVSSCLDDLRGGLSGLDDRGIVDTLRQVEEISRRAQSVMLDAVAEAEARGIAAQQGLGALIQNASSFFQLDIVYVGIISIGLIALAMDLALRAATRRLVAWQDRIA